ncbi:hypothetical protein I5446_00210 [Citrobacter freundii]|uniref:hypothetical protein n=1 Tax=Citrobacter freundii TaxID=546 RepID=UPI0015E833A5|nr:hypothetical protein [Citrobacter freundii]MBJ9054178.1 hypothetical protein [Citrobacter freundii]MBJ9364177.1 hypothetical protein [Citrobacter freundii]
MSNKYEDLIKNARMNADCGEHMSPAEVTTLLNVVETTFAALAGEVYDLKHPGTYLPSKRETPATDAFLAEVRAQGVKSLSNAVQSVISERQRQQSVEGWTPEHDDEHTEGEMAEAAACYAMFANNQGFSVPGLWPWAREWWKQSGQRRDLVKAGALILAEIERIDRQESAQ